MRYGITDGSRMQTVTERLLLTLTSDTSFKIFIFINENEFISKKATTNPDRRGDGVEGNRSAIQYRSSVLYVSSPIQTPLSLTLMLYKPFGQNVSGTGGGDTLLFRLLLSFPEIDSAKNFRLLMYQMTYDSLH